jgi:hypothetical protein
MGGMSPEYKRFFLLEEAVVPLCINLIIDGAIGPASR